MSCAINPRCGVSGQIQPVSENERKKVMVIGGGPAGMMAAQTLVQRGHSVKLYEKSDRLGGLLNDACLVPFKTLMREYLDWVHELHEIFCGAFFVINAPGAHFIEHGDRIEQSKAGRKERNLS